MRTGSRRIHPDLAPPGQPRVARCFRPGRATKMSSLMVRHAAAPSRPAAIGAAWRAAFSNATSSVKRASCPCYAKRGQGQPQQIIFAGRGRSPRETTFSLSCVSTKRGFGGAAPEKSTFSLSCVSTKRGLEGAAPRKIPFHFSISFRDRKVKKPDQKAAVLLQPRKWGSGSDEMPVRRIQCHCVSICHVYKRTSRQKGAGIW